MTDRVGAIDCGTNSIRLLIADGADGGLRDIHREMRIVRLGQGVDATGRFAPDALARTQAALTAYAELMRDHDVSRVRMVATSATRDAANRDVFFEMTADVLGAVVPGAVAEADRLQRLKRDHDFIVLSKISDQHQNLLGHGATSVPRIIMLADRPFNLRGWCAVLAALTAVFAAYVSLVPFNFTWPPDATVAAALRRLLEVGLVSRSNFAGNVLLFTPLGFFGRNHVAGQNQFHRLPFADEPREPLRAAAAGYDAKFDFGLAELRFS